MRIKHWSGYGSVEVKKLDHKSCGEQRIYHIEIIGDHEQGLLPIYLDMYTIDNWLCKRLAKDLDQYTLTSVQIVDSGNIYFNGERVEFVKVILGYHEKLGGRY